MIIDIILIQFSIKLKQVFIFKSDILMSTLSTLEGTLS